MPIGDIWVYLAGSPLLALFLTLAAYHAGDTLSLRLGRHPLANPVLIAVLLVVPVLSALDMPYRRYFEGAQFVHFLLGTATVALAVPIYRSAHELGRRLPILLTAMALGGMTSILTAVGVARLFHTDEFVVRSFYAKSVTTPIAMGVAQQIGAAPTLTAVFAIVTGILGAALGRPIFNALGLQDMWLRGFSLGTAAHGVGTSRALSVSAEAGAYASLAMGLHGIAGALLIPPLVARLSS